MIKKLDHEEKRRFAAAGTIRIWNLYRLEAGNRRSEGDAAWDCRPAEKITGTLYQRMVLRKSSVPMAEAW